MKTAFFNHLAHLFEAAAPLLEHFRCHPCFCKIYNMELSPDPGTFVEGKHTTGILSLSMNENKIQKDLYCIFQELICFIQRNQGHRYSVMHEFSSNEDKIKQYLRSEQ